MGKEGGKKKQKQIETLQGFLGIVVEDKGNKDEGIAVSVPKDLFLLQIHSLNVDFSVSLSSQKNRDLTKGEIHQQ